MDITENAGRTEFIDNYSVNPVNARQMIRINNKLQ